MVVFRPHDHPRLLVAISWGCTSSSLPTFAHLARVPRLRRHREKIHLTVAQNTPTPLPVRRVVPERRHGRYDVSYFVTTLAVLRSDRLSGICRPSGGFGRELGLRA